MSQQNSVGDVHPHESVVHWRMAVVAQIEDCAKVHVRKAYLPFGASCHLESERVLHHLTISMELQLMALDSVLEGTE